MPPPVTHQIKLKQSKNRAYRILTLLRFKILAPPLPESAKWAQRGISQAYRGTSGKGPGQSCPHRIIRAVPGRSHVQLPGISTRLSGAVRVNPRDCRALTGRPYSSGASSVPLSGASSVPLSGVSSVPLSRTSARFPGALPPPQFFDTKDWHSGGKVRFLASNSLYFIDKTLYGIEFAYTRIDWFSEEHELWNTKIKLIWCVH